MNVMVDMLAGNDWCNGVGLFDASVDPGVFELGLFLLESGFHRLGISVSMFSHLGRDNVMGVFFR